MTGLEHIMDGLNPEQKQAVTETEGYIRVIAGAGSGKTRALTRRYAYLVDGLGIEPSNILCVTFTNKAAQEMRGRVRKLVGGEKDTAYITTYHGFCVRVLREDIHHLYYPKNFVILDVEDQKDILREIYSELGLTLKDQSFSNILKKIGFFKALPGYVRDMISREETISLDHLDDMEQKIIEMYLRKQKKIFGLDFEDLMNFVLILFHDFPHVLEKWQDRLHYIQVDEFQDSSKKQFDLVEMLSRTHQNLFVVGDPDQTIYEWRGANTDLIVNFENQFPGAKTIVLDENYRSTPEILDFSNDLIRHNRNRVPKMMKTRNSSGPKTVHFHGKNEQEEATWIAKKIHELASEGTPYHHIAILYRANYLSRFIEQALIQENIEYTIYGGFKFFERMEIKDALAHLRLVAFEDDLSFMRIVNKPRRQVGKKRLAFLREHAEKEGLTLYEALQNYIEHPIFKGTQAKSFLEAIESGKQLKDKLSVSELLQFLLEQTGYEKMIREDGDQDRLDNLQELKHSIHQFEKHAGEDVYLDQYLQMITLYTDTEREEKKNTVKLMTIHTAKGLEFPYVFVTGLTESIFPNVRSIMERKERALEEERRLMYVASTRAMKKLYITESEGFTGRGMMKYPSRFIFEVDRKYYHRIGDISKEFEEEAREFFRKVFVHEKPERPAGRIEVGAKVEHPVFGEGTIESIHAKKGVYMVRFFELDAVRPISQNFKGLTVLSK
ncbi:MAG: UvrD-helicase domain-containing protein [Bacillaceae bacterium]|nr:UvrD-helicase domain-containing protein [Bacillaceae bacterium]